MRGIATLSGALLLVSCGDSPVEPLRDARGVMLVVVGIGAQAEIYAMRSDGSERRRLTNNSVQDTDPAWSPDGRQIVYISFQDSTPGAPVRRGDVYVMNANGTGQHRVVQVPVQAWHPRWSPDGGRISFESVDPSVSRFRGFVANSDGMNPQPLADLPGETFHLEWSPDGTRLLFLSNRSPRHWWTVYTINANGTGEQQLSGDDACTTNIGNATWSNDGQRIAFSCDSKQGLFTMAANGTDVRQIPGTALPGVGSPVWSPDDVTLAFISNRDNPGSGLFQPRHIWDVFTVPTAGGTATKITASDTLYVVSAWQ